MILKKLWLCSWGRRFYRRFSMWLVSSANCTLAIRFQSMKSSSFIVWFRLLLLIPWTLGLFVIYNYQFNYAHTEVEVVTIPHLPGAHPVDYNYLSWGTLCVAVLSILSVLYLLWIYRWSSVKPKVLYLSFLLLLTLLFNMYLEYHAFEKMYIHESMVGHYIHPPVFSFPNLMRDPTYWIFVVFGFLITYGWYGLLIWVLRRKCSSFSKNT